MYIYVFDLVFAYVYILFQFQIRFPASFQPVQASLVLQFTAAANGAANVVVNGSVTPTPSRKNSSNARNNFGLDSRQSSYGGSAYSTMERRPHLAAPPPARLHPVGFLYIQG